LDNIKALGYKYSTISRLTTSVFDMKVPAQKKELIDKAEKDVEKINAFFARGLITDEERYRNVVDIWSKVTVEVSDALVGSLDKFNPIAMMMTSGARGNRTQLQQLAGMRGLMQDPSGKTIEIPIKSSFREGMSVLEYFVSSHGGRKGLADTALKTADSGYLTRRLVDVSHNVIIREDDCFAATGEKPKGMYVSAILDEKGKEIEGLEDRLIGRFTVEDVVDNDGNVIVPGDVMITEEQAAAIVKAGVKRVLIRSVFTCKSKHGICAKCYGKNMSNMLPVNSGEAVGIIAAQSIGEPGTQLTMRNFHSGGVASAGDITRGLPRVEELFEARKPKGQAIVCEVGGTVTLEMKNGIRHVVINTTDTLAKDATKDYLIPFSSGLLVKEGDVVEPGTVLTTGSVYPQDILRTKGVKGVQDYILQEVQAVYRSQGVEINDKHVEIIVRQMLRRVRVENGGDTGMLQLQFEDAGVSYVARARAAARMSNISVVYSAFSEEKEITVAGHKGQLGLTNSGSGVVQWF
ncbi:MAG: DNA-directed RNA polymerase subunit beta', partial [Clostridia bacterium]|nr:DNA-directed RNA polymerase subunit beta' [Clostridia bacterium]